MGLAVKINSEVEYWQLNSNHYFDGNLPRWAVDAITNYEFPEEIKDGKFDISVSFGEAARRQDISVRSGNYIVWDEKLGVFPISKDIFEDMYAKVN